MYCSRFGVARSLRSASSRRQCNTPCFRRVRQRASPTLGWLVPTLLDEIEDIGSQ